MEIIKIRELIDCGYLNSCTEGTSIYQLECRISPRFKLLFDGELVDLLFVDVNKEEYDKQYYDYFRLGEFFTYDLVVEDRNIIDIIPRLPWASFDRISKRWKLFRTKEEIQQNLEEMLAREKDWKRFFS